MDRTALLDSLSRTRTIHDVRRLFVDLGYAPDDRGDEGAHAVARWRGFHVLAAAAVEPREAGRGLARRLALTSRRALAVSWNASELVLAAPRVGAAGITPLLVVPLAAPTPLALQLLADLAPRPRHTGLAHALRVAELLGTERAGERFFRIFRVMLERMAASLAPRGSAADRRALALEERAEDSLDAGDTSAAADDLVASVPQLQHTFRDAVGRVARHRGHDAAEVRIATRLGKALGLKISAGALLRHGVTAALGRKALEQALAVERAVASDVAKEGIEL